MGKPSESGTPPEPEAIAQTVSNLIKSGKEEEASAILMETSDEITEDILSSLTPEEVEAVMSPQETVAEPEAVTTIKPGITAKDIETLLEAGKIDEAGNLLMKLDDNAAAEIISGLTDKQIEKMMNVIEEKEKKKELSDKKKRKKKKKDKKDKKEDQKDTPKKKSFDYDAESVDYEDVKKEFEELDKKIDDKVIKSTDSTKTSDKKDKKSEKHKKKKPAEINDEDDYSKLRQEIYYYPNNKISREWTYYCDKNRPIYRSNGRFWSCKQLKHGEDIYYREDGIRIWASKYVDGQRYDV